MNYLYASDRPWAISAFLEHRQSLKGNWFLVTNSDDLQAALPVAQPEYIFFPHWSEIVPEDTIKKYDCVCFHMTDLPYGRGGSPLQNLIVRGIEKTKLTALKMVKVLDAGPIYRKDELELTGSAEQIFNRMSNLAIKQIQYIIEEKPVPKTQSTIQKERFKRRLPGNSEIQKDQTIKELYDHIRMLDAPGYPKAFLKKSGFTFEFNQVTADDSLSVLTASVKIYKTK